jgi:hypothetical protein
MNAGSNVFDQSGNHDDPKFADDMDYHYTFSLDFDASPRTDSISGYLFQRTKNDAHNTHNTHNIPDTLGDSDLVPSNGKYKDP